MSSQDFTDTVENSKRSLIQIQRGSRKSWIRKILRVS